MRVVVEGRAVLEEVGPHASLLLLHDVPGLVRQGVLLPRAEMDLGAPGEGEGPEISWWGADGPMAEGDWASDAPFALRCHRDDGDLLIVLNAGDDASLRLPEGTWQRRIDTAQDPVTGEAAESGEVSIGWQSVVVFKAALAE